MRLQDCGSGINGPTDYNVTRCDHPTGRWPRLRVTSLFRLSCWPNCGTAHRNGVICDSAWITLLNSCVLAKDPDLRGNWQTSPLKETHFLCDGEERRNWIIFAKRSQWFYWSLGPFRQTWHQKTVHIVDAVSLHWSMWSLFKRFMSC